MNLADEVKKRAYEDEVKRMRSQFGEQAEIPNDPYSGHLHVSVGPGTPVMTVPARISELAKQAAEAAHMLAEARSQYAQTQRHLEKCKAGFIQVSEALLGAIHEHREGTPENVPYQP
jgi:hypothetical protein